MSLQVAAQREMAALREAAKLPRGPKPPKKPPQCIGRSRYAARRRTSVVAISRRCPEAPTGRRRRPGRSGPPPPAGPGGSCSGRCGARRARLLGLSGPGELGVGELELRERVADRANLLGVLLLDQGQQGAHPLDRKARLVQVAHVLGAGSEAQALAAEVHEADDGLEQHVADRDAPQLLLELGPKLLLGGLSLRAMLVAVCVARDSSGRLSAGRRHRSPCGGVGRAGVGHGRGVDVRPSARPRAPGGAGAGPRCRSRAASPGRRGARRATARPAHRRSTPAGARRPRRRESPRRRRGRSACRRARGGSPARSSPRSAGWARPMPSGRHRGPARPAPRRPWRERAAPSTRPRRTERP